ncbi:MAG: hypothetical protein SFW62_03340, partial [Alphaproteobacteria bacterium]|nr:hypothetical protein [Alphaproteobacteria bacterium]
RPRQPDPKRHHSSITASVDDVLRTGLLSSLTDKRILEPDDDGYRDVDDDRSFAEFLSWAKSGAEIDREQLLRDVLCEMTVGRKYYTDRAEQLIEVLRPLADRQHKVSQQSGSTPAIT